MEPIAPVTLALLLLTLGITAAAFRDPALRERWMFDPRAILVGKQYERMLTSGFIHADWMHLGMNMLTLYLFGEHIEFAYGWGTLVGMHLGCILGGSLLSLWLHRHHDYRALGASGGVCGVVFAYIFLLPGGTIGFILLPIHMPPVVYAVLFLVGSYFADRKGRDNVGHDAHLGGAMSGLLLTAAFYPHTVVASPKMFAVVTALGVVILWLLVCRPFKMPRWLEWSGQTVPAGGRERDYAQNRARRLKRARMDELLDKVSREGIHRLSKSERAELEELSKEF
jgi:membrane associated rhomboid family serine protease